MTEEEFTVYWYLTIVVVSGIGIFMFYRLLNAATRWLNRH